MMKALEIAIEKLKALPEERQAYAAEVLEQIAATDDGVFHIPEEHMPGVLERHRQTRVAEEAKRLLAQFLELDVLHVAHRDRLKQELDG